MDEALEAWTVVQCRGRPRAPSLRRGIILCSRRDFIFSLLHPPTNSHFLALDHHYQHGLAGPEGLGMSILLSERLSSPEMIIPQIICQSPDVSSVRRDEKICIC